MANRTARYRAKLKAKHWKERARKAGTMKKTPGAGRLKKPHKRTLVRNVPRH